MADVRYDIGADSSELVSELAKAQAKIRDMEKSMRQNESAIGGLNRGFSRLKTGATAAVTAIAAVAYSIGKFVKMGMDAEEATSKFNTIFGQNQQEMREWADTAARSMSRSSRDLQNMSADVMALVSPMAATREAALGMSRGAVQAAEDLASFNNVSTAEALQAIRSGLIGSSEPLTRFGILTTEAALQEYALSQGIRKRVSEMTSAEKLQLRYNAILAQMGAAQGDAARTSTSLTNTLRGIQAIVRDSATDLGERMVPGITRLAQAWKQSLERGGPLSQLMRDIADGISGVSEAIGDQWIESMNMEDLTNEFAQLQGVVYSTADAYSGMQDQASAMIDVQIRAAGVENSRYRQLDFLIKQYTKSLEDGTVRGDRETQRLQRRLEELRAEFDRMPRPIATAGEAMRASLDGVLAGINRVREQSTTESTRRTEEAAKAFAARARSLRDNLTQMWAEFSRYVGELGDALTLTVESNYRKQLATLQENLRHRVISQAEYNEAVVALEEETERRRAEIAERGVMFRNLVETSGLTSLTESQRSAYMQMAQNVQDHNTMLAELRAANMLSEQEATYFQMSLADARAVRHAELEQQMVTATEQNLRARFGLESRAFQATQMFASVGAALMGDKNKQLHRIGQVAAIAQIGISASEGIVRGFAKTAPNFAAGAAYAALMGIVAARQIQQVWAQKPPQPVKTQSVSPPSFATGVFNVPQDIHGATVHRGETIIPKSFTDSIKAGELSLGGGAPNITINVQGGIIDKDGFLNSVGDALGEIESRTGLRITSRSVY